MKYLLASGPSRKFDVLSATRSLRPSAPGLPDSSELLFATPALNNAILLKYREPGISDKEMEGRIVPTLVYMPYDPDDPDQGGEAFFFSQKNYRNYFKAKTGRDILDPETVSRDCEVLAALDAMPTLSPYLISEQMKRLGIEVSDEYLQVPGKYADSMKQRVRAHLFPLVETAFGGHKTGNMGPVVDEFARLVLDSKDADALAPLGMALRLEKSQTLKSFTAWAGIAYFEDEFKRVEDKLHLLVSWLKDYSLPQGTLPRQMRENMVSSADGLRRNIRDDWSISREVFDDFNTAYKSLLDDRNPLPFRDFLSSSQELYWRLGDILGRLEQLLGYWEALSDRNGDNYFPYEVLDEFYSITNRAYRNWQDSSTQGTDGTISQSA
ncbi:MAG: hypothetical protein Alpg2KO_32440 [Alphaproteobacteria bacterium]